MQILPIAALPCRQMVDTSHSPARLTGDRHNSLALPQYLTLGRLQFFYHALTISIPANSTLFLVGDKACSGGTGFVDALGELSLLNLDV
jgi:hypothetical protein